jgi:UDP-N-acetylglucosamine 2-epimerase (non-hydrolysing)
MNRKVLCVVGTRPEVVKMAPLVLRLRRERMGLDVRVLTTGQHRELLDLALADFGLTADDDLSLMRPDQALADLTARALVGLSALFERERPALVLAQGDTTTVLCAALACYYKRIPFGHVEAGLRTGNPYFPFPEEKNRVLAGHLAELHFAPTATSRQNLLREGIADSAIHVTGNTVIDALLMTARRDQPLPLTPGTERFVLVTAHRRENFGPPMDEICRALRDLVERDRALSVVFPVHPNPNVRKVVNARLAGHERIHLIEPVGYRDFVALMKKAYLIVTDSGGVQEEGPSLGKPVLVLRDETERPEAVAAGTVLLLGPHHGAIVSAVEELCQQPEAYARFARVMNPYGDGWASERIARILADRFGTDPGPVPVGFNLCWPPVPSAQGAGRGLD